ncbi:MAG: hypothetical protein OXR68_07545 [Alphaproteobacteria bacterium]|nr:hypothetical protein [Alphaproteobacteria bacterium]MDD9920457.1 hypothetical protein [Alphaproteobacteria bacterium]
MTEIIDNSDYTNFSEMGGKAFSGADEVFVMFYRECNGERTRIFSQMLTIEHGAVNTSTLLVNGIARTEKILDSFSLVEYLRNILREKNTPGRKEGDKIRWIRISSDSEEGWFFVDESH